MSVGSVYEKLAPNAVAVQLPIGIENEFNAVIDLIERKAYKFEGNLGENIIEEERQRIRAALEKYCGLDTKAMVDIVDGLEKVSA